VKEGKGCCGVLKIFKINPARNRTEQKISKYVQTVDVEFEDVPPRAVGVGDLDAIGRDEWPVDATHHVDLRPLAQLLLPPDHRELLTEAPRSRRTRPRPT